MTMTAVQEAEFRVFCHKDGLSPSGTHLELWKKHRPLGLLIAIWAVHHGESPSDQVIEDLTPLERYAQPLLPSGEAGAIDGSYLTPQEVAAELNVTLARVRQLVMEERLNYVETALGRLFEPHSVARYRDSARQSPGRPLKEDDICPEQPDTAEPTTASA